MKYILTTTSRYTFSSKILFFGSGKVGYPVLRQLKKIAPTVQAVTHRTEGRKCTNQVQIFCKSQNIPFYTPLTPKADREIRKEQWTQFLKLIGEPDIGVVCSYGYMLPKRLIQKFKEGMIVVHPSLLPKYRGGAPIFHAIANGETKSGVSFIQISTGKFDSGNLLYQVQCDLSPTISYQQAQIQLAQLGAKNIQYFTKNIHSLRPGKSQQQLIQDLKIPQQLLKAPLVSTNKVDLLKTAEQVYNFSRAIVNPHFVFEGKNIIFYFQRQFFQDQHNRSPGSLVIRGKKALYLKCKDKLLRIKSWKEPTKKQLHSSIFIKQHNLDQNSRVQ